MWQKKKYPSTNSKKEKGAMSLLHNVNAFTAVCNDLYPLL